MGTEGISLRCWGDSQRPQVLRASKQEILLKRVEVMAARLGKEALSPLCPSWDKSPGLPFHLDGTSGWRAMLLILLLHSVPTPHSGTVTRGILTCGREAAEAIRRVKGFIVLERP